MFGSGVCVEDDMNRSQIVIVAVVIALMALIATAVRFIDDSRITDETCRFRLFRVGSAVNLWLEDNGHPTFPQIQNPAPHEPWMPRRPGSASLILGEYLSGNTVPSKNPRITEEEHLANLRKVELTTCPKNQFDFWYNYADLNGLSTADLISGKQKEIWLFRCQTNLDDSMPHKQKDKGGVHIVYSTGNSKVITHEQAKDMQSELQALLADNKKTPNDLNEKRIEELRGWLNLLQKDGRVAGDHSIRRLTPEVRFSAK